eukprot:10307660-Alexandrium_andersonii.AAC.1
MPNLLAELQALSGSGGTASVCKARRCIEPKRLTRQHAQTHRHRHGRTHSQCRATCVRELRAMRPQTCTCLEGLILRSVA